MRAIQLDLFSGMAANIASTEPKQEKTGVNLGTPAALKFTDPCRHCELKEWCTGDDCGQKLFPIDMPFPPSHYMYNEGGTRFRNLQEFILFKKYMGWL